MNDTLTLLKGRRSAPADTLAGPGPTAAEVAALLTVAARVPDHGKLAPWRFITFTGEGQAAAGRLIAAAYAAAHPEANAERLAFERRRLALAPLVVGVVSAAAPHAKIPEWEQVLSAGAVCMNLLVAATAMGYGAVWLTEWYAYDRRVFDGLGLAAQERMAGFIHIGRPTIVREDRPRPALADIVTHFGQE
jgi:nitroreductase